MAYQDRIRSMAEGFKSPWQKRDEERLARRQERQAALASQIESQRRADDLALLEREAAIESQRRNDAIKALEVRNQIPSASFGGGYGVYRDENGKVYEVEPKPPPAPAPRPVAVNGGALIPGEDGTYSFLPTQAGYDRVGDNIDARTALSRARADALAAQAESRRSQDPRIDNILKISTAIRNVGSLGNISQEEMALISMMPEDRAREYMSIRRSGGAAAADWLLGELEPIMSGLPYGPSAPQPPAPTPSAPANPAPQPPAPPPSAPANPAPAPSAPAAPSQGGPADKWRRRRN